jgi:RimJ/RimL family protein N-acetyltransferase
MNQSAARWHVKVNATDEEVSPILARDPVWNCFALADLEPPMRTYSQFTLAFRDDGDVRAVCLILRHPIIGEVISPFGDEEGIEAILQRVDLPERPLLQVQEMHSPLLQRYYRPQTTWRELFRMVVTAASWRPSENIPSQPIKQLDQADLPALQRLYAQYAGHHFSADLFTPFPQSLYFGAYRGEHIIAAGGTHAVVPAHKFAVLGNILTAAEARRQGYATAITSALVTRLFEQGFSHVILNVFVDNADAVRVYQRLGFQARHRLVEGQSVLTDGTAYSSGGSV